jgi:hypothetical protein
MARAGSQARETGPGMANGPQTGPVDWRSKADHVEMESEVCRQSSQARDHATAAAAAARQANQVRLEMLGLYVLLRTTLAGSMGSAACRWYRRRRTGRRAEVGKESEPCPQASRAC